jgi:hypothetical protein
MASLMKVEAGPTKSVPLGVVSDSSWNGFVRGEYVKIDGRPGTWTFYEHTRTLLGATWVTVYGGSAQADGARQFVSVEPERIRKTKQPAPRK